MSDAEINKAVAELRGWKFEQFRCVSPDGKVFRSYPLFNQLFHSPNYAGDLNAMHEAEKMLTDKQWLAYQKELSKMPYLRHRHNTHATARQRAEAFLKTLGKWRE